MQEEGDGIAKLLCTDAGRPGTRTDSFGWGSESGRWSGSRGRLQGWGGGNGWDSMW